MEKRSIGLWIAVIFLAAIVVAGGVSQAIHSHGPAATDYEIARDKFEIEYRGVGIAIGNITFTQAAVYNFKTATEEGTIIGAENAFFIRDRRPIQE